MILNLLWGRIFDDSPWIFQVLPKDQSVSRRNSPAAAEVANAHD
jgi:hypothetical protein